MPFLHPEVKWDFRLKWVVSISTSGHKYGLVYPGIGWIVWKTREYLPEQMSFSVNYLGAKVTQVGLNFSRPAAQILGQYYQFIRLGFQGYKSVHSNLMLITEFLHKKVSEFPCFKMFSDKVVNPLFIFYLNPDFAKDAKWTLFDLQDKLKQSGWMVPAYAMPNDIHEIVVMRIVIRTGFGRDMADILLTDLQNAVEELNKLQYPSPSRIEQDSNVIRMGRIFTHC